MNGSCCICYYPTAQLLDRSKQLTCKKLTIGFYFFNKIPFHILIQKFFLAGT